MCYILGASGTASAAHFTIRSPFPFSVVYVLVCSVDSTKGSIRRFLDSWNSSLKALLVVTLFLLLAKEQAPASLVPACAPSIICVASPSFYSLRVSVSVTVPSGVRYVLFPRDILLVLRTQSCLRILQILRRRCMWIMEHPYLCWELYIITLPKPIILTAEPIVRVYMRILTSY